MKKKKIEDQEVRRYIWDQYRKDGYTLFFETDVETRHEILQAVFEKYTGYQLIQGKGLVEKAGTDRFDGYHDFSHLRSIDALLFDLEQTNKASRDKVGRYRRNQYRMKKEQFERRRQQLIESYAREEHLQKWEPQDAGTRKRIEDMRRARKREQDKNFER